MSVASPLLQGLNHYTRVFSPSSGTHHSARDSSPFPWSSSPYPGGITQPRASPLYSRIHHQVLRPHHSTWTPNHPVRILITLPGRSPHPSHDTNETVLLSFVLRQVLFEWTVIVTEICGHHQSRMRCTYEKSSRFYLSGRTPATGIHMKEIYGRTIVVLIAVAPLIT